MEFLIYMLATVALYAGAYFLGTWLAAVYSNRKYGPEWVAKGARDAAMFGGTYHFESGTPWIQKFYDEGFYAKLFENKGEKK